MEEWKDWQKPYRFGTLVIWPPDRVRQIVNRQRFEYDPVSRASCEAHITLTQPLLHLLMDTEWDLITRIVSSFDAFQIEYGPVNSFLPYPAIYYEVHPKEKVLEIREALHQTGVFNLGLPHTEGFIPHMTITEGQSGPPVDEALVERLGGQVANGSFVCDDIAYVVPDQTFHCGVVRRLPLGGQPRGERRGAGSET